MLFQTLLQECSGYEMNASEKVGSTYRGELVCEAWDGAPDKATLQVEDARDWRRRREAGVYEI